MHSLGVNYWLNWRKMELRHVHYLVVYRLNSQLTINIKRCIKVDFLMQNILEEMPSILGAINI
jgi:hypothetical protein